MTVTYFKADFTDLLCIDQGQMNDGGGDMGGGDMGGGDFGGGDF